MTQKVKIFNTFLSEALCLGFYYTLHPKRICSKAVIFTTWFSLSERWPYMESVDAPGTVHPHHGHLI